MCWLALCHCDKIPEINSLQEGKVCFGSQLQRFQTMETWLCCFGPVAAQYIMKRVQGSGGLCTLWEREKKKGGGSLMSSSWAHPQQSNFLLLGPTFWRFHHLPIAPWSEDQAFKTRAFGGHLRSNYSSTFRRACFTIIFINSFCLYKFSLSWSLD